MRKPTNFLLSSGLSLAAAYYFDPVQGRRRRALLRDKLDHLAHEGADAVNLARRDLRHRARGTLHEWRGLMQDDQPSDEVLEARVRSALGRVVSNPHAIDAEADNGRITLSGPILQEEVGLLLDTVYGVPGVKEVTNSLETHQEPGREPALQGARPRYGSVPDPRQDRWSPSTRLLGGLAGGAASLYGLSHRGFSGLLTGAGGLWLMARAISNESLPRMMSSRGRAIEIQKSLCIHAPVEAVYRQWSDVENFPHFMSHVREVRRLEGDQERPLWRWTVTGPGGLSVQFDSRLTQREENRLLAWRTEGENPIEHSGRVRFTDNGDNTTNIEVRMAYRSVAGTAGHLLARLFGVDPMRQLNDDLLRLKTTLETGKPPHDAAREGDGQQARQSSGEWLQH